MTIKKLFLICMLFSLWTNGYAQHLSNNSIKYLNDLGYNCASDGNVIVIPDGGCTGCKKELISMIIEDRLYENNFIVVHPAFSFYFVKIHSDNLVIDKDLKFLKSNRSFLADAIIFKGKCKKLYDWKIVQFIPKTTEGLLDKLK